MADRKNGLAPLPSGLFRPTTANSNNSAPQVTADAPAEEPTGDDIESISPRAGGEAAPVSEPRTPRTRRKRVPVGGESRGRKLNIPDAVYDRLQLLAIQRRSTASAIASELLDRNLPRLRIERD